MKFFSHASLGSWTQRNLKEYLAQAFGASVIHCLHWFALTITFISQCVSSGANTSFILFFPQISLTLFNSSTQALLADVFGSCWKGVCFTGANKWPSDVLYLINSNILGALYVESKVDFHKRVYRALPTWLFLRVT